jgi:mono/diheme cytochrome c family protein
MKKKTIRIIVVMVILVIVLVPLGIIGYIYFFLPNVPLKDVRIDPAPERIERGNYLANHVTVCIDCHSTRDWNRFSGPLVAGTEGKGGEKFDEKKGFPGTFYAPNITPFHLSTWTDAEIYRAITAGMAKDGRALFPVMPYIYYGTLDDEDVSGIIAYIRSLPSIDNTPPPSSAGFPMNLIMRLIPKQGMPGKIPDTGDRAGYGKYLVTASGCIECHTPVKKGQIIEEKAFSGGREFNVPFGILRSPNITPDPATGIGSWTLEAFVFRFRAYDLSTYQPQAVTDKDFNTLMPWTMYAGMTLHDLEALYEYLRTLTPVVNKVEKTTFIR